MSNLKLNLAALRDKARLTVGEAAEATQVARRTWQRWERAGQIPTGALKRFCEATGLDFRRFVS